jgi:hypothetical protein
MATVNVSNSQNFVSGETVTPAKLNALGLPTVTATIDNSEVTTAKIADANVTADKLSAGAVTGAAGGGKLAASAITGQTVIADALADTDEFLVHDASASALRKVAYSNIAPTVTAAKLNGVAKDGGGNNLSAGDAPIFGCRAWVNFDGTKDTTGAASTANTNRLIRARGNVTSVLRNSAGDYTITFTTAMPDANYCVIGSGGDWTTANGAFPMVVSSAAAPTASTVRITNQNTASDHARASVAIFR